jgi:hypothetical protein
VLDSPLQSRLGDLPSNLPMKLHDLGPALPLVIALAFQGWVTYRVWRSRVFERAQKFNQAKLIWLLPVLGAIMVFSVLSQEERAEREGPQLRL